MFATLGYYISVGIRAIIGGLDGLVYKADAMLYELMMDIASAKIFSADTIKDVSMRVYQLLGLVMLFRLIFAFLTYVINPEDMTDKNKGYTKIVKKIFTSLALVIITPWLFTQSRNLQIYIINDKLIEYFIFGTAGSSQTKPGYELMYTVGKVFNTPYKCANEKCEPNVALKESCRRTNWDEGLKTDSNWTLKGTKHVLSTNVDHSKLCAYGASDDNYANMLYEAVHPRADGEYNLFELMKLISMSSFSDGQADWYVESPLMFVGSTLVGFFIGYVLLMMCMDIALRSIKLAFYEMIAPVPILSNLGMKDGKDSMLNKWFHEVLKTYADLFTRVAGLQIATFAIDELVNHGALEGNSDIYVSLFLIIGALMFAKKLPDILKGMGINFEGGGSFNIKKKLNDEVPVLGKRINQVGSAAAHLAGQGLRSAGRLASTPFRAGWNGLRHRGFNIKDEWQKSLSAAGARAKAGLKATGGSMWKGAVLGQDYKAKVADDAKRYEKESFNKNLEKNTGTLISGGTKAFERAFGKEASSLWSTRSTAKASLNSARNQLLQAEQDFKNGKINAETLSTYQKNVKDGETYVSEIEKRLDTAISSGYGGEARKALFDAYKRQKDFNDGVRYSGNVEQSSIELKQREAQYASNEQAREAERVARDNERQTQVLDAVKAVGDNIAGTFQRNIDNEQAREAERVARDNERQTQVLDAVKAAGDNIAGTFQRNIDAQNRKERDDFVASLKAVQRYREKEKKNRRDS